MVVRPGDIPVIIPDGDTKAAPLRASELRPVAVLDMGASAIRLVVAEAAAGRAAAHPGGGLARRAAGQGHVHPRPARARPPIEATLKALEGFRRIMDTYGVVRYRAVATSAVREAHEPRRLPRPRAAAHRASTSRSSTAPRRTASPTWRCARRCADHEALTAGDALLVEVGGGSADISFLRKGEPIHSGTYAARLDPHAPEPRLLARQPRAGHAPAAPAHPQRGGGHPPRDAAARGPALHRPGRRRALRGRRRSLGEHGRERRAAACCPREPFLAFCDQISAYDVEQLVEQYRLPQAEAETLVPALLAYRELLLETAAEERDRARRVAARRACCSTWRGAEDGPGHRGLLRGRCWPAPRRSARSTATTRRHAKQGGAAGGAPVRRAARRARPAATATACCWRWRRCSTTSAST